MRSIVGMAAMAVIVLCMLAGVFQAVTDNTPEDIRAIGEVVEHQHKTIMELQVQVDDLTRQRDMALDIAARACWRAERAHALAMHCQSGGKGITNVGP